MRAPLMSRGFLPRELPPPFSSESLGTVYGAHVPPSVMSTARPGLTSPVAHNLPRAGLMRRPLSIPDPIRYMLLVNELAAGWGQLQPLLLRARLSLSRPRRDHTGHRAYTFRYGFSSHPVFRAQIRAGARYILQSDINQFYPSLYTHVIPWAIHGKAFAKANRSLVHIGNLLDKLLRDGQDGQTMGIPIGPDTSFLLAEILLGSFDADLIQRLGNRPGIRVMDAYEFPFDTYSEAEEGISSLQDQLAEFELNLNHRKTAILECPIPLYPPWLMEL